MEANHGKKSAQKRKLEEGENPDESKAKEKRIEKEEERSNVGISDISVDITNCSICLDTVSSSIMKSLPCAHVFHETCIDKWFKKAAICPICRWSMAVNSADFRDLDTITSGNVYVNTNSVGAVSADWSSDFELEESSDVSESGRWDIEVEISESSDESQLDFLNVLDSESERWNDEWSITADSNDSPFMTRINESDDENSYGERSESDEVNFDFDSNESNDGSDFDGPNLDTELDESNDESELEGGNIDLGQSDESNNESESGTWNVDFDELEGSNESDLEISIIESESESINETESDNILLSLI